MNINLLKGVFFYRAGLWLMLFVVNNLSFSQMGFGTNENAGGLNLFGLLVYIIVKKRRKKRSAYLHLIQFPSAEIRLKGASVFVSYVLFALFWTVFCQVNHVDFAFLLVNVLTPFFIMTVMAVVGIQRFNYLLRKSVEDESIE